MIPIRVKLTIAGDKAIYDFTGSHPTIGSIYNSAFGATFSAVAAGMKTFFPDLPLNSGFYRCLRDHRAGRLDRRCEMADRGDRLPDAVREDHELDLRDLVRSIMPHRAIACAFNLEYLLTGGIDARSPKSRSSCSTTGCPAAGADATARTAATSPRPASAPA